MRSPSWSQLSPQERKILAPLAPEWDKLDAQRKQKWRGLAQRYPRMAPDEQQRVQQQMNSWAKLSPQERAVAREQYKSITQLPPEKKAEVRERWQAYQTPAPGNQARVGAAATPTGGHPPTAATRPAHRQRRFSRNRPPQHQAPGLDGRRVCCAGASATCRIAATARRRSLRSPAGDGPGVHHRLRDAAADLAGAGGHRHATDVPPPPARVALFCVLFSVVALYFAWSWTGGRRTLPLKTWRMRVAMPMARRRWPRPRCFATWRRGSARCSRSVPTQSCVTWATVGWRW